MKRFPHVSVLLALAPLLSCGQVQEGTGVVVIDNRHTTCQLNVTINDGETLVVQPRSRKDVVLPAGGQELRFDSTQRCLVYTRHEESPFDSGRPLCNTDVEDGEEVMVLATGDSDDVAGEVHVRCPE